MKLDGTSAIFELVPELIVSNNNFDPNCEEIVPIKKLLKTASAIIESNNFLKIEFDTVLGIAVDTDIDVDLYGGLQKGWDTAPKIAGSNSYYPFLEIENSPWKKQLPNFRGRDEPDIKHYRLISWECSFDVLAWEPSGKWISE